MKRFAKIIAFTLFVIHSFIPVLLMLSNLFVFSFSLTNYTVLSVICAFVSAFTLVVVFIKTELFLGNTYSLLFGFSLPLCVIDWVFFLSKCDVSFPIVLMLVAFVCVAAINVRLLKSKGTKIILSVLTAVCFLFVTFFAVIFVFMDSIGASTVFDTVQSPDEIYYADIIDVDQGALGGNMVVKVSKKRKADVLIFRFEEKGKTVYIGEWNEYGDMEIFWKGNDCLVINSEEYIVRLL